MTMISGHHRQQECNCWIKCSSFACLHQWLLCANFIKPQKVCCNQRTGLWMKIKCLLISYLRVLTDQVPACYCLTLWYTKSK